MAYSIEAVGVEEVSPCGQKNCFGGPKDVDELKDLMWVNGGTLTSGEASML